MKNSFILKTICFIVAPILVFILICSLIFLAYTVENPDYKTMLKNDNYFESLIFSDFYKHNIASVIANTNDRYYYSDEINGINYISYTYSDENFNYLFIDKSTNEVYTNITPTVNSDTVDKIKKQIMNNKYYWNYAEKIDTNINNLSEESISYTDYIYESLSTEDFEIYSSVNEDLKYNDNFVFGKCLFAIINIMGNSPMLLISPLCLILLIIICSYLILSLGHKKDYEGIYLNYLDKLPLGVLIIILSIIGTIIGAICVSGPTLIDNIFSAIGFILLCLDIYICFAIFIASVIKRIKAETLLKNTLTYRILKWLKKIFIKFKNWLNKSFNILFSNTNSTLKLGLIYFGFIFGSMFLWAMTKNNILVLLVPGLWVYVFILLLKKIHSIYKIKDAIHDIYQGKSDIKLDEAEFSGDFIEMASDVNDIAGGFSNAIAENLKSERLKTELITNVSHDIKTPLTSIISYVDLLKQENIDNEKAQEYINVLDSKSQRLKKLIEDLVEASKASSGNIKLTLENLNVKELLKQCIGEFEDRFKNKNLNIITNIPKEDVHIQADSRYMYRVIENLFSNINKYALENSRVYIDVTKDIDKIKIDIKNISKEKLNISPDELMQRFVRGDKSRFTEGSGLGLSISKSLTELQNGNFEISIDGDLFKVNLSFDMIK